MITPKQHEVLHSMSPDASALLMRVSRTIAGSMDAQANKAGECLAALVLTMPVEDQRLFAESVRRFAEIRGQ